MIHSQTRAAAGVSVRMTKTRFGKTTAVDNNERTLPDVFSFIALKFCNLLTLNISALFCFSIHSKYMNCYLVKITILLCNNKYNVVFDVTFGTQLYFLICS